jgi:hypothetical protein
MALPKEKKIIKKKKKMMIRRLCLVSVGEKKERQNASFSLVLFEVFLQNS